MAIPDDRVHPPVQYSSVHIYGKTFSKILSNISSGFSTEPLWSPQFITEKFFCIAPRLKYTSLTFFWNSRSSSWMSLLPWRYNLSSPPRSEDSCLRVNSKGTSRKIFRSGTGILNYSYSRWSIQSFSFCFSPGDFNLAHWKAILEITYRSTSTK